MLTLIATALGLVSSLFPDLMKMWKDKESRKHDIKILELQMQARQLGHELNMDEVRARADISETKAIYDHASIPSNVNWVEGLRASVRPVITYSFFILFTFVKVSTLILIAREGAGMLDGATYIWDSETQSLFAAIVSFWFGHRALQRHRETSE